MNLRNWIAATVLVLGAMCMTAPAAYADVGLTLDPIITVDQVAPADFVIAITEPAADPENYFHLGSGSTVADLPGSGEGDEPVAAFCPAVAPRLMPSTDGDPLRIDDPGWCLS